MTEWVSLGERWQSHGSETFVAVWEPGDGLACTSRGQGNSALDCGRPVAKIKKVESKNSSYRPTATVWNSCSVHLASKIKQLRGSYAQTVYGDAKKAAIEEVVANHWDEYNAILSKNTQSEIDDAIAQLPDELAAAIRKVVSGDV